MFNNEYHLSFTFHSPISLWGVHYVSGRFSCDSGTIANAVKLIPDQGSISEKTMRKSREYKLVATSQVERPQRKIDAVLFNDIIQLSRMVAREDRKSLTMDDDLIPYFDAVANISTGDISDRGESLKTIMTVPEIIHRQSHSDKRIQVDLHEESQFSNVHIFPEVRSSYKFSGDVFEEEIYSDPFYGSKEEDEAEEIEHEEEKVTRIQPRTYNVTLRNGGCSSKDRDYRSNVLDFSNDQGDIVLNFKRSDIDAVNEDEEYQLPRVLSRRGQKFSISFSGFIPDAVGVLAITRKIKANGGTVYFDGYSDAYLDLFGKFDSKHYRKNMTSRMKFFVSILAESGNPVHTVLSNHLERNKKLLGELEKKNFVNGDEKEFLLLITNKIAKLESALKNGSFDELYEKNKEKGDQEPHLDCHVRGFFSRNLDF